MNKFKFTWQAPHPLTQYKYAPRSKGVYAIGSKRDNLKPLGPAMPDDGYSGENWPENFRGLYVGISLSTGSGIRGRLSSHARRKGNKDIADEIRCNNELFFIACSHDHPDWIETFFIIQSQPELFPFNKRSEIKRD